MRPYTVKRFKGTPDEVHAQWIESRAHGLGGSDMAAAMGLNAYRTPLDVWLEKTGRVESEDISGKPAVHWGTVLEDVVAAEFAQRHPELKVRRMNGQMWSKARPYMFADVDRLYGDGTGETGILEIKTASIYKAQDWGPDGSGNEGVPEYYLPQVLHYMLVTGYRKAAVAVLIGGQDYREYRIEWDDEDGMAVSQAAEDFWKNYVQADVMPQLIGTKGETDDLAGMFPDEDGESWREIWDADVPKSDFTDIVELYQLHSQLMKENEIGKRKYANRIMAFIGDDTGFRTETRQVKWIRPGRLTVKEIER